jgi:hypothetical protein
MRSHVYDNEIPGDDVGDMEEVAPIGNFATQIEIEYKASMACKVTEEEQNNIKKLDGGDFRVLTWWKIKGFKSFPIMALVTRSVRCIPAASAMSENDFSDAGITVTKKRNSLKPRVVDDLLFLRSNRDITNTQ